MNKMKKYLKTYILFVYDYYIKEDFEVLNKIGKVFIYPAWLFRSFLAILYSIFSVAF
jgi:hypothetical protein